MVRNKLEPLPLEGKKVVAATSMREAEEKALEEHDATAEEYMQKAAEGLFLIAKSYISDYKLESHINLLCAHGNNSGDAYAVGEYLLAEGFTVSAFQISPLENSSTLCQRHAKQFNKKRGKIVFVGGDEDLTILPNTLIIDGLLGIGCRGEVKGLMKEVIDYVNELSNPVLAIDMPSGVCGDTGKVHGTAIFADVTAYMETLKVGYFFNQGYEHIGVLKEVPFGMSEKYLKSMEPFAFLVNPQIVERNLPQHKRGVHKYSRGEALIIAGSEGMTGAAILASRAAMRSGSGIVRLFHKSNLVISSLSPEVVTVALEEGSYEALLTEMHRSKAILIGPGLGRGSFTKEVLEITTQQKKQPLVIDGDALFFFERTSAPTVLTPHRQELMHLLKIEGDIDAIELISLAKAYAKEKGVVLIMKGAPTLVISPQGKKIIIPYGNVGMASAGMGDVLAGILVALLAQGKDVWEASVLAATIHGMAGDRTKEEKSSYSMVASDLIETLPEIFKKRDLINQRSSILDGYDFF